MAFNLAKAIFIKGHEVFVITTVEDQKDVGQTEYEGLQIIRVYSKYHRPFQAYLSLYNPKVVLEIKKIVESIKPDVVHAHNIHYHLSYHCLKIAKESGAKVFLTAHDAMLFHYGKVDNADKMSAWSQFQKYKKRYNPFRNWIIRRYLKYVEKIFVVSRALEEALNNNGITNTLVIHNGIDVSKWKKDESKIMAFKEKYHLTGKKVMLFGGRISEAKGSKQAQRVLEIIKTKVPEALLLVAGREMLEGAVNVGWLSGEELKSAYASSDVVLVLSTYLDPFPTVNLEAMASAKPVIGTSFGGTPEIVVDGKTGYIVDPFNVSLVSEKVTELLLNDEKAANFGQAGFERVQRDFSMEKFVEKILNLYSK